MLQELKDTVKKLISEKKVDIVIGWKRGTLPGSASPLFIQTQEDADELIFDSTCRNNLTAYLTKDKRKMSKDYKKTGIIVKGCDARSVVLYAVENQVKRENIFLIGVPCEGVYEKKKIRAAVDGKEILGIKKSGNAVTITGRDFEIAVPDKDVLSDSCIYCRYPDALEYDVFIGEPRKEVDVKDEFAAVKEFEKKTSEERWEYIKSEYSKCIRCYACRNVCPSCYCNECFVDQNNPQWIGKTPEMTDSIIFHLIRNLHTAGRCVDCGSCVSACPAEIDLRIMSKKVEKEIKERFDYTAGLDINEKPVMATFCEHEKQDFIMS
ncbi:MAG: 4Fe-4S dicluster domain-containing protein [Candidatus Delongbacteria bacterium]|nr:4Fe-4S dicluster domain-containing protein [Candidatus Delongbacteria bacterium]MCG2761305.1 4Fe-4S dicluster domain-containing protein [Candidatus Delongbacteria bacterium]